MIRIASLIPVGGYELAPAPGVLAAETTLETVDVAFVRPSDNDADLLMMDVAMTEAAMRAEDEGFDAAIISTLLDYGLNAARSACRMPVIGAGQSSLHLAATLGRRFSIVNVWPASLGPKHAAHLRAHGLEDRCASMRFVAAESEMATLTDPDNFYAGMRSRRADMLDRIATQIRLSVEEDGADVIVLGCTCMTPVANEMRERFTVPIVDPMSTAAATAELMVKVGVSHSPSTYAQPAERRRDAFSEMVAAAAASLKRQHTDWQEVCEVCVVGSFEPDAEEPTGTTRANSMVSSA